MRLKRLIACLFLPVFLCGCYAAAWDRDKLDLWDSQQLSESLAEELPDLQGTDEVRVLVFGDSGEPSTFEVVAGWMGQACSDRCDFALMLGDNFYTQGPAASDPDEFRTHFKEPLTRGGSDLADIPYWVVLGNHGYYRLFVRPAGDPAAQLAYTNTQGKGDNPYWLMPAHRYAVPQLPDWMTMVGFDSFFAYDRRSFNGSDEQYEELREQYIAGIHESITDKQGDGWRLLFGHHPYISSGSHADKNGLQGVQKPFDEVLPLIYFSGHDHDQQVIETGGFIQVIQGAASKTRADSWGSSKARAYFNDELAPAYAARGEPISAEYCEKLGFAVATFWEHEFELTFYWGDADEDAPQGQKTWFWTREPGDGIIRAGGAENSGFSDFCPGQ